MTLDAATREETRETLVSAAEKDGRRGGKEGLEQVGKGMEKCPIIHHRKEGIGLPPRNRSSCSRFLHLVISILLDPLHPHPRDPCSRQAKLVRLAVLEESLTCLSLIHGKDMTRSRLSLSHSFTLSLFSHVVCCTRERLVAKLRKEWTVK